MAGTRILGILNLTPDSFYAPSRTAPGDVVSVASGMMADGAWALDLGAVSTRPGSAPVSADEEWARLEPALLALRDSGFTLSVDTFRSEIVSRVYDTVGPFIVNDITAGAYDPGMLPLVGKLGLPYIAMHLHGSPYSPSETPGDVVEDVTAYFRAFALRAADAGIADWILDPGFGFSKTLKQNWDLLYRLSELQCLGRPVLAGISRKSMLWKRFGITPADALPATQAAHLLALQGGATYLRVHDVAEAAQTAAIFEGGPRVP
ncbi:MAG: dihydropteroate synthase [Bacteroidales bacterium]|nr:dihydropteroate synthase [Bacteroidales bacterium]